MAGLSSLSSGSNLRRVLLQAAQLLQSDLGLTTAEAKKEAQLLLQHASQLSKEEFLTRLYASKESKDHPVCWELFHSLLQRRRMHEPLAYLVHEKEFWSLPFQVDQRVLIPRPDSESIVTGALEEAKAQKVVGNGTMTSRKDVLDLGVGSGCLLLSILSSLRSSGCQAHGVGIDISPPALAVAQSNVNRLGLSHMVTLLQGSWTSPLATGTQRFDLIVSNPPYIESEEMQTLDPGVRQFEPRIALEGGLGTYLKIAHSQPKIEQLLKPDGVVLLEVGWKQAQAVRALVQQHTTLSWKRSIFDLNGVERCLVFQSRDKN